MLKYMFIKVYAINEASDVCLTLSVQFGQRRRLIQALILSILVSRKISDE
jgi:hypothetical protein